MQVPCDHMPRPGSSSVWATSEAAERVPGVALGGRRLALLGVVLFVAVAVPVARMDLTPSSFQVMVAGTVGGYLLGFVGMAVSAVVNRRSSTV